MENVINIEDGKNGRIKQQQRRRLPQRQEEKQQQKEPIRRR